ncbi:hypothetical protein DFH28DRAFT_982639 [Melampsora americana]|nr:hypothetical protein DFH28DRAFT_982639 [Melampsora americana]
MINFGFVFLFGNLKRLEKYISTWKIFSFLYLFFLTYFFSFFNLFSLSLSYFLLYTCSSFFLGLFLFFFLIWLL